MAFSKNNASLIGRAGRDPETFTTKSGGAICKFSLATDSRTKSPSGDWETSTDWHNIVCFGKLAEIVQQYLAKGMPVARRWSDLLSGVHRQGRQQAQGDRHHRE